MKDKEISENGLNEQAEKKSKSTYIILIVVGLLFVTVLVLVGIGIQRAIQNNSNTNITPYISNNIIESRPNENSNSSDRYEFDPKKPIIYIYPTETTEVEIKLGNPQYLSCSYPKYKESWKVTAKPNGDLIDKETGRSLYALYWEGEGIPKNTDMQEGYCIKGENTAKFLEEKLAILGLNERESEEFIVYWLPQMEDNRYNYIRFETIEEQNDAMPLQITPKPDNLIRVMMDWKGLDEPIKVQEQEIETPSRNGYTVVEWGGSKIE